MKIDLKNLYKWYLILKTYNIIRITLPTNTFLTNLIIDNYET